MHQMPSHHPVLCYSDSEPPSPAHNITSERSYYAEYYVMGKVTQFRNVGIDGIDGIDLAACVKTITLERFVW